MIIMSKVQYALGHPKQRKFKFDWMKSFCFGCPNEQISLQHGRFSTMRPLNTRGPFPSIEDSYTLMTDKHT